jgi:replicative DNA helicase
MESTVSAQPPQNIEAEASLLGALLIDSDAIVKIADKVSASDFFDKRHERIYEAMRLLYERREALDVLTLADKLKNNGYLEMVGGASYLTELTNFVPTASHVEQYAEIVAQKAMRRRLIAASQDMVILGHDESKQLSELIEDAESRLFEVSQSHVKQNIVSLEAILAESFDRLDELHKDKQKIRGVPTGYKDLDNTLAGFQRSDLIILAARPSMGKTALALNFAHNIAIQAHQPVLIFSLEMSKEQLVDRLLSMESGVDAWALRTGNLNDADFEKIGQAMGTLSEAQIFIDDSPGITVSDLRTKARREAHQREIGLIIVDYLQLMSGSTNRYGNEGNRVQEISEISRGLKGIARELNVPVLALSQLSRSVESRSPQIPQLADLRESGCLAGDTLVYQADTGKYVTIKDLAYQNIKPSVTAINDKSYKLETAAVSRAFSTGRKLVFSLTMTSGKTIKATSNHKFLTVEGWKRLDELQANEHIATPRFLPNPPNNQQSMSSAKEIDVSFIGSTPYKDNLSRERALRVATAVKSRVLTALAESDIYWDQIQSIESAGIEEVFDLTVPGQHNFVANDIIVHNSIEQDADVVAFIYREDWYNPETDRKKLTDILIKKHRNGPTGAVELYFDNEKQRFRSVDTRHQDPFTT